MGGRLPAPQPGVKLPCGSDRSDGPIRRGPTSQLRSAVRSKPLEGERPMGASRTVVSVVCLGLAITSVGLAQGKGKKVDFGVFGGASFAKPGGPDATNINGSYT